MEKRDLHSKRKREEDEEPVVDAALAERLASHGT